MAIFGFILLMAIGVFMLAGGIVGILAAFGFSGQVSQTIPGIVIAIIGVVIIWQTWAHKPFTLAVTMT